MGFAPGNPVHFIAPWLILFQAVRRLHDIGRSAVWLILGLLAAIAVFGTAEPLLGAADATAAAGLVWLIGIVALGAIPGTKRANAYGAPPSRRRRVRGAP